MSGDADPGVPDAAPAPGPSASFRSLVAVQAAHSAGDALVAISLAGTLFFSVPIAQARDRVGLYLLLTMTPFAVISPVVGPLLDRWRGSYRVAIFAAAAGRAVLAFSMATRTQRFVLYPLAFGSLVLSRTHGVSRSALLPEVLPRGWSLIKANSRMALVSVAGAAAVAGPGAALQRWIGPGATLRFAGSVLVLGALAAIGLPQPQQSGFRRQVADSPRRTLAPRLRAAGAATASSRAAIGFLVFFLAFLLRRQEQGARGFALVVAAAGAGGVAGSLVTPRLTRVLRGSVLLLASLAAMGIVAIAAIYGFSLREAAIVAGAAGLCASAARLGFDSLIQLEAPEDVRGRAFARYETIFQLCWVAGAGLATAVPFGPAPGLVAVTAICTGGVMFALRSTLRLRTSAPP